MLNIIWMSLMLGAVIIGCINHTLSQVVMAVSSGATLAVTVAIGLVGVMTLWLGIMNLAQDAGLLKLLARLLQPLMARLFPDIPRDHPAMGAMVMNFSANMLGLGNAATPFGLRAMEQLEKLNPTPGTATDAMCLFLTINTSSIQLIPITAIAILSANGAVHATEIIVPTLIATTCSTLVGVITAKSFAKISLWKIRYQGETL